MYTFIWTDGKAHKVNYYNWKKTVVKKEFTYNFVALLATNSSLSAYVSKQV